MDFATSYFEKLKSDGFKSINDNMKIMLKKTRDIPILVIVDRFDNYISTLIKLKTLLTSHDDKKIITYIFENPSGSHVATYKSALEYKEALLKYIDYIVRYYKSLNRTTIRKGITKYIESLYNEEELSSEKVANIVISGMGDLVNATAPEDLDDLIVKETKVDVSEDEILSKDDDNFILNILDKVIIENKVGVYKMGLRQDECVALIDNLKEFKLYIKDMVDNLKLTKTSFSKKLNVYNNRDFLSCHCYGNDVNVSHLYYYMFVKEHAKKRGKKRCIIPCTLYNKLYFHLTWNMYYFHNTWISQNPFPIKKQTQLIELIVSTISTTEDSVDIDDFSKLAAERNSTSNEESAMNLIERIKIVFETKRTMDNDLIDLEKHVFRMAKAQMIKFEKVVGKSLDVCSAYNVNDNLISGSLFSGAGVTYRVILFIKHVDESFFITMSKAAVNSISSTDVSNLMSKFN